MCACVCMRERERERERERDSSKRQIPLFPPTMGVQREHPRTQVTKDGLEARSRGTPRAGPGLYSGRSVSLWSSGRIQFLWQCWARLPGGLRAPSRLGTRTHMLAGPHPCLGSACAVARHLLLGVCVAHTPVRGNEAETRGRWEGGCQTLSTPLSSSGHTNRQGQIQEQETL